MSYIFEIAAEPLRALPRAPLTAQVARALKLRVEQYSREQLPGLWRISDQLRRLPKAPDAVLEKRRRRARIWAALCLALGIFAFLSGAMVPTEPVLVVVGAAAIGMSVARLLNIKSTRVPFRYAAGQMIDKLFSFTEGATLRVTFSDNEMALVKIVAGVSQGREAIPYSDFEYTIETDDLYLLSYVGFGTVLPKICIPDAEAESFRAFLASITVLLHP